MGGRDRKEGEAEEEGRIGREEIQNEERDKREEGQGGRDKRERR